MAWQLHTLRPNSTRHWKVGDSPHCIPSVPGPVPKEAFTAQWASEPEPKKPTNPAAKLAAQEVKKRWKAVARHDVIILPESIATVTAVAKGAPNQEAMYLEGSPLKRGSDSFICTPDGIVDPDSEGHFQIKVANTTHRRKKLRAGETLGQVFVANDALKASSKLTEAEQCSFTKRVAQLASLAPNLDTVQASPQGTDKLSEVETEAQEPEALGWGPKTTEPSLDQIYPSEKLREVIDIDPSLKPEQRDALYKVVERNQAAFGFDGRLNNGKKKRKMSAATVNRNRIRTSALIDYCSNINADRVWWTTLIVMNRIRGVGVIVDNNITMHKNCQEMETMLVSFRKRSNNLFCNVALAQAILIDKIIFQDHQRTGWRAIDHLSNRPYARTSTTESFSTDVGE